MITRTKEVAKCLFLGWEVRGPNLAVRATKPPPPPAAWKNFKTRARGGGRATKSSTQHLLRSTRFLDLETILLPMVFCCRGAGSNLGTDSLCLLSVFARGPAALQTEAKLAQSLQQETDVVSA